MLADSHLPLELLSFLESLNLGLHATNPFNAILLLLDKSIHILNSRKDILSAPPPQAAKISNPGEVRSLLGEFDKFLVIRNHSAYGLSPRLSKSDNAPFVTHGILGFFEKLLSIMSKSSEILDPVWEKRISTNLRDAKNADSAARNDRDSRVGCGFSWQSLWSLSRLWTSLCFSNYDEWTTRGKIAMPFNFHSLVAALPLAPLLIVLWILMRLPEDCSNSTVIVADCDRSLKIHRERPKKPVSHAW